MHIKRRELLFAGLSSAALGLMTEPAMAIAAPTDQPTLDLWPGNRAPGGPGPKEAEKVSAKGSVTQVSRPRLVVYRPERPNGTAMLVIAGGGYAHIERGTESTPACLWLQSQGVTAFELVYRLPGEHWPAVAPLQDLSLIHI